MSEFDFDAVRKIPGSTLSLEPTLKAIEAMPVGERDAELINVVNRLTKLVGVGFETVVEVNGQRRVFVDEGDTLISLSNTLHSVIEKYLEILRTYQDHLSEADHREVGKQRDRAQRALQTAHFIINQSEK